MSFLWTPCLHVLYLTCYFLYPISPCTFNFLKRALTDVSPTPRPSHLNETGDGIKLND